jgi:hypothetical protein
MVNALADESVNAVLSFAPSMWSSKAGGCGSAYGWVGGVKFAV